ncbi:Protein MKS1 [Vitis vinifera]|uniref:Protein MKS1 n=1 Tax=Vitis vinifera TaxID=29760 RepID=A0A438HLE8_VITVI|nr:Protein MKS1 [Vitis vinifera]
MMNPPDFFSSGGDGPSPQRRELQIQGPRPAPLKVSKESHKIKKPPTAPLPAHRQTAPPPPENQNREPVIIYTISPKVIHTTVNDFLSVVQRLTGNYATSPPPVTSQPPAPVIFPLLRVWLR